MHECCKIFSILLCLFLFLCWFSLLMSSLTRVGLERRVLAVPLKFRVWL